MFEHALKWEGKSAAQTALNARFGSQVEPPECDDRTYFWQETYWLAARGRPHTHGIPLQLDPLRVIDLIDALELPAGREEAVVVICAMDDAWLEWKDSQQSRPSKTKAAH
ncbi:hypothetical protein Q8G38_15975 [Halomonas venusta]|uniref:hypothetical protein n=1 Tax=Vreelandella venusta TaxID=44935 RepID=UPI00295F22AE|nr:hypothetical protein [Halomonas venusta]MDW0360811.1 hypothetical protein [Halomonas venusta]